MPRTKGSKNKSMKLTSPESMAISSIKSEVITAILGPELVKSLLINHVKSFTNYKDVVFEKSEIATCKQGFMVTLTNPKSADLKSS